MEKPKTIPWPGLFAEGTAIVVSILLAFAIDAWWQERREQADYRAQVETLLGEFRESRARLQEQLEVGLTDSLDGTSRLLEMMGPEAEVDSPIEVNTAIGQSLAIGVFSPELGSLESVLLARGEIDFIDDDTWARLQLWPIMMNDLEVDSRHLERSREETFMDALIRLEISLLAVIRPPGDGVQPGGLSLPESRFDTDLSILLKDPGMETVFTMRAIRMQLLMEVHRDAIRMATQIIEDLEASI
ncbi:MAG: hypothetical protein QNI99_13310 [Woeseiaceae bacterium]|nr:hypothetical protein [Woeseiaceae bacterium]